MKKKAEKSVRYACVMYFFICDFKPFYEGEQTCEKTSKIPVTMRITGIFPMLLSGKSTAIEQACEPLKYCIFQITCALCVSYKSKFNQDKSSLFS